MRSAQDERMRERSDSQPPKMLKDDFPPGGAWIRVVERPVITFPQFWLLPFANALDDMVEMYWWQLMRMSANTDFFYAVFLT